MTGIAIVIGDLSEGGAQRVATTLAAGWITRGQMLTVITLRDSEYDFFELPEGVRRIVVGGSGNASGLLGAVLANFRRIRSLRRAIIESNARTIISFIGTTNVLAVLACRGLKVKLAISERNDPARQSLGRVWDYLRRRYYRNADIVTANSSGALQTLGRFVPSEKLALVLNPLTKPPAGFGRQPEKMILNIGRLTNQKAQDVLINAFAALAPDFPDWKLVIAGTGTLEKALKSQAEHLGIADKVDFPGQVEPWIYYSRASVFALPSRYEGTPNALLEAMSIAIAPIVSNASEGPLNFVAKGKSGLVVPVDDPKALSLALRELMADENKRKTIGNAAQESVASCNMDRVLDDWEKTLGL
jgi:GalNAc-alpha-(1->4)-GalNAc-alpha-(1->3)-diNAcBac-PP-undecaprenol alpha-1,4-N-acetyl-D-galactosaminyltransferase